MNLLRSDVFELGGKAEKILSEAADSIVGPRRTLKPVYTHSATLPLLDLSRLQDHQNPVVFIATIRIIRDLEQLIEVCQDMVELLDQNHRMQVAPRALTGLRNMCDIAAASLKDVLDAYAQQDPARAEHVWQRDVELDLLECSVYVDILAAMSEDPSNIKECLNLLLTCKHIERVGDFATNIAESVYEILTGTTLPFDRPKRDALA
jgi:phosphate transport system protein